MCDDTFYVLVWDFHFQGPFWHAFACDLYTSEGLILHTVFWTDFPACLLSAL